MKKVVLLVAVIVVAIVVPMIAHVIMELTEIGRETQQTLERTAEEVQKAAKQVEETGKQVGDRLEPPKITDVVVEEKSTKVTISWTTTKPTICEFKGSWMLKSIRTKLDIGTLHDISAHGLLPGKEYSFTIECLTGPDHYEGSFKTKKILDTTLAPTTPTTTTTPPTTTPIPTTTPAPTSTPEPEPPAIKDVVVETKATRATITWTTTKPTACVLLVERLGAQVLSRVSSGTRHSVTIFNLLPRKEYSFTIKCLTGSDYHEGTFKTERR